MSGHIRVRAVLAYPNQSVTRLETDLGGKVFSVITKGY